MILFQHCRKEAKSVLRNSVVVFIVLFYATLFFKKYGLITTGILGMFLASRLRIHQYYSHITSSLTLEFNILDVISQNYKVFLLITFLKQKTTVQLYTSPTTNSLKTLVKNLLFEKYTSTIVGHNFITAKFFKIFTKFLEQFLFAQ